MTDATPDSGSGAVRYSVSGMDCRSCVEKIESAVRQVDGVEEAKVSFASQLLTVRMRDPASSLREVERAVADLGYQIARVKSPGEGQSEGHSGDDDDLPKDLSHVTPAYRRALKIVIFLNVGYGVVEAAGGFFARSQALKADALDFLGDGLITMMGLLAVQWSLAWRARSALIQGLFLGALGLGVLGMTLYRVLVLGEPTAELMGIFGGVALAVNVTAAVLLIPHRTGDANMRAVWLFSRNDALGNLAVVVAAGLVAWTGTPWPDLVAAFVIASLFLQSSWSIVRDARADLREVASSSST